MRLPHLFLDNFPGIIKRGITVRFIYWAMNKKLNTAKIFKIAKIYWGSQLFTSKEDDSPRHQTSVIIKIKFKYNSQNLNWFFHLQRNIFINGMRLVIGDFGHAKYLSNTVSRMSVSKTAFGTYGYHAPEANKIYDEKIDIWYYCRFILYYHQNLFITDKIFQFIKVIWLGFSWNSSKIIWIFKMI